MTIPTASGATTSIISEKTVFDTDNLLQDGFLLQQLINQREEDLCSVYYHQASYSNNEPMTKKVDVSVNRRDDSSFSKLGEGEGEAIVNLQQRLSDTDSLLSHLTGQLEEAKFALEQLRNRMEKFLADLDYRITELERQHVSTSNQVENRESVVPEKGEMTEKPSATVNGKDNLTRGAVTIGQRDITDQHRPMGDRGEVSSKDESSPRLSTLSSRNSHSNHEIAQKGPLIREANSIASSTSTDNHYFNKENNKEELKQSGVVITPAVPTIPSLSSPQLSPPSNSNNSNKKMEIDSSLVTSHNSEDSEETEIKVKPQMTSSKEQYARIVTLLNKADYVTAERAALSFLERNPTDALAGHVQYWLGETYYARGAFQQAATAFAKGYQNYAKSDKAPANVLKLGLSLIRLDRTQDACTVFSRLISSFPNAKEDIRNRAVAERRQLGCK